MAVFTKNLSKKTIVLFVDFSIGDMEHNNKHREELASMKKNQE